MALRKKYLPMVLPDKGGIYQGFTKGTGALGPKIKDPIVSNGEGEAGGKSRWAYLPQALPNAALQNVYKIPEDKVEGKFHTKHFRK